jgi:Phage virion morphogenesis family
VSDYVTFLETDWVGDDEAVQALIAVENWVGDLSSPMLATQRIAIDDTREHFENEVDPDGIPWHPLSEITQENRQREGSTPIRILHRWGELEKAATSTSAWPVTVEENSAELMFDMSKMPETINAPGKNVGWLHQAGNTTVNQSGNERLPARPFVGLSERAQNRVNVFFDAWFDHSERLWIRPEGTIQTRVRGAFGPMFSLD